MSYFGGIDSDERGMLHDLINVLLARINTQERLIADATRKLDAAEERLRLFELTSYGAF